MNAERLALCTVGYNALPDELFPEGRLNTVLPTGEWRHAQGRGYWDGTSIHAWAMRVMLPGEEVTYADLVRLKRLGPDLTGHAISNRLVTMFYPGRISAYKIPICLDTPSASMLRRRDDQRIPVKTSDEGFDWLEVFEDGTDTRLWQSVSKEVRYGNTVQCPVVLSYALMNITHLFDGMFETDELVENDEYQTLLRDLGVYRSNYVCADGCQWQTWLSSVFKQPTAASSPAANGLIQRTSIWEHPLLGKRGTRTITPQRIRDYQAKLRSVRDQLPATPQDLSRQAQLHAELLQEGHALICSF